MADYLYRRTWRTAPWNSTGTGPPPDAGIVPAPPIAPALPAVARGVVRAAVAAYAILIPPPPDAGASVSPPVATSMPGQARAPARSASTAYTGPLSATPPDAGTSPIAASMPDRARPPAGAAATAYLVGPVRLDAVPPGPVVAVVPDRAIPYPRAAATAYAGLLSASPPDAGTVPAALPVAARMPDRARGPARAAATAYAGLVSATPFDWPWSHVQGTGAASNGVIGAPLSATFASATAAGNLVVVSAICGPGRTMGVSDSAGNAYQPVATTAPAPVLSTWYVQAATTATLTVSVSVTGADGAVEMAVDEYNYAPGGTIAVAGSAVASGTGPAPSAGPITSAGAIGLDYGAAGAYNTAQGTITPAANYTTRFGVQFASGLNWGLAAEDRLNDGSGSATPGMTLGNSVDWLETAAVFVPDLRPAAVQATHWARGPARAAATAYAGLVSSTPPDAGASVAGPAGSAMPHRAPGPARAASTAYAGLLSTPPPDAAIVQVPAIAAQMPHRAPGPARAASTAYAGLLSTPPPDAAIVQVPAIAAQMPHRAPGPARAASTTYVGLIATSPPDFGIVQVPAIPASMPAAARRARRASPSAYELGQGRRDPVLPVPLGRFRQGDVVGASFASPSIPVSAPTAAVYDQASHLIATIPLWSPDGGRTFRCELLAGQPYVAGTYSMEGVFACAGGPAPFAAQFTVVAGGDAAGGIISLYEHDGAAGRFVLTQVAAGRLLQGRDPWA